MSHHTHRVFPPLLSKMARAKTELTNAAHDFYIMNNWTVVRMKGSCDLIASRGDRRHFVQVVDNPEDPKYNGVNLNAFVQNAMSHSAAPVQAMCKNGKWSFVDVNTNKSVIVTARTTNTPTEVPPQPVGGAQTASGAQTAKPAAAKTQPKPDAAKTQPKPDAPKSRGKKNQN